jgi:mannose-1-phosphate guanylyltransferase
MSCANPIQRSPGGRAGQRGLAFARPVLNKVNMDTSRSTWAVVLAAGDGTRVRDLSRDDRGLSAPKQFCRFGCEQTLLEHAIARAHGVTDPDRVLVVVAESHRAWWWPALGDFARENVLSQPRNRGTAPGLLLPVLEILDRDPAAVVAVLPSDHVVEDEATLRRELRRAVRVARLREHSVLLLGMQAGSIDGDYGWILARENGHGRGPRPMLRFVEKPAPPVAAALLAQGALRNSFLLVSSAGALLRLYRKAMPELLDEFRRARGRRLRGDRMIDTLYASIPDADFSREILERFAEELEVLPVPECGWRDLGTPAALAEWVGLGI